jgi:hypothetical protein
MEPIMYAILFPDQEDEDEEAGKKEGRENVWRQG